MASAGTPRDIRARAQNRIIGSGPHSSAVVRAGSTSILCSASVTNPTAPVHPDTGWSIVSSTVSKKPTLRTYEMICYYFIGLADEEELLAHIAKLKSHNA